MTHYFAASLVLMPAVADFAFVAHNMSEAAIAALEAIDPEHVEYPTGRIVEPVFIARA